jgi:glycosyltransferase involved in cell wall biosynthesis
LRLAVVSPFVDRRHGTERALTELLERLARSYQCEIHLYSERVEDLALGERGVAFTGKAGTIFWHRVPSISGPHLIRFVWWLVSNRWLRWCHLVFRGLSCDLVLSPGINCLDANVVIVHALFHRLRELADETPMQGGVFRRFHRRAYYGLVTALERQVYSDKRVWLAGVSQRTANLIGQYFGRNDIRVISNGVDTREFSVSARAARRADARRRFKFRDSDFVLLLIGNDWRVKGLPSILRAMAQLAALPLHLVVVGDDDASSFHNTARRLGVFERSHWEAPGREVIAFYAAADVYVSPSLEDSFGLPVAEAMACGLPVITSSRAGISTLIRDGIDGFVLKDPEDTQALARVIERLYADEGLRRRVGQAAAAAVKEWTWDRNAAEVWELLEAAAAKGG